ncbi:MAG: 50S ribosomal protein L31 [bacterium]
MKSKVHPKIGAITVKCSCGNEIVTRSTKTEGYSIEICSSCHPFYTGKTKIVDTAGRIEKFKAKYSRDTYAKKK